MAEIIGLIILIASFLLMGIMIYRKIPLLAELSLEGIKIREGMLKRIKNNVRNNIGPRTVSSSQNLLLKIISKARILFLKGENKMGHWLNALRQKSVKKKKVFSDNYWEKLKEKKRGRKSIVEENSETLE